MLSRRPDQGKFRPDASPRRVIFIAALLVFWMLAIGVRLVYLQISSHEDLVNRGRRQQQYAVELLPQRGKLLDRQGRELARSIDLESVFVAPEELEELADVKCTAQGLATTLNLDQDLLTSQLLEAREGGNRFVWIKRRVSTEQVEQLKTLNLPGVHWRKEPKRYYPNGSMAAHVLGFVGLDGIGLGGVEQIFDEKITGEPGRLFLERDSRGRVYESFELPSQPGDTVVLTLDQSVQYRAERALEEAVRRSGAKSGTAIVLEARTGEILALANAPVFDPNNPGSASPGERSNWALQNIYEPGSTFKIVAFAAALEKGLVKPEDRIDCQMGSITVAGRVIRDHSRFGSLTISEALAKSSNVGAIKLGLRVGNETMYDFITRFGFGARTGIELPGETPGLLRPVKRWQASSIGSIAIGQEIGVTPLQMASAFAAVANDGVRVAPHLVREIRSDTDGVIYRAKPERRQVIGPETAIELRSMLEGVTLRGTAKSAQLDGYSAAGKTGTAQKIDPKTKAYSRTKHVASFVGFAPVENPAVVIVVVIDEPGGAYHGGQVAAPIFREIGEQILPDLGIAPDIELRSAPELIAQTTPAAMRQVSEERAQVQKERNATLPRVAHRRNGGEVVYAVATDRAIVMPDLRGQSVRDVARACAQLGLQLEAYGEGLVMRQNPAPGAEVEPGQTVYLNFGRAK